jgi:hypothetical protein
VRALRRTAGDDNVLLLMQLAALPLATPPAAYLRPASSRSPGPGFTAEDARSAGGAG